MVVHNVRRTELTKYGLEEWDHPMELFSMNGREFRKYLFSAFRERQEDASSIICVYYAGEIAACHKPVDQANSTVVTNTEPFGEAPNRYVRSIGISLNCKKGLLLT